MFLRTVEIFRHCTTAQLIRIAEIARQESIDAGAPIYLLDQPADAMYCVIEGRIEMSSADGRSWQAEKGGTFGLTEILSDELRETEAIPESTCRLLVIEAEDLLDLLSNNIEIVRSLFRQLLSDSRKSSSNDVGERRVPA